MLHAASSDDASSKGGLDDDNDDSNAKDRAMAALSNPGGEFPSDQDAGGGKDRGDEGASTTPGAAAASILPPLPGYESDFGSGVTNGSARIKDRRKRRPHVKMKRRSGQRGSSQRERVVK